MLLLIVEIQENLFFQRGKRIFLKIIKSAVTVHPEQLWD